MWPLEASTIKGLTAGALVASLIWYLIVASRDIWRNPYQNRADFYLRFRPDGESKIEGLSSADLNRTFMASAFSLASALYVYIEWAAKDRLLALWSPLSWASGVVVLAILAPRIFRKASGSWTLHNYLGQFYESDDIRRIASLVTSLVFFLQVAAEIVVGVAVLRVFFSDAVSLTTVAFFVGLVLATYCVIGGLPSVLHTDKLQYFLICAALGGVFLISLDRGGATAVGEIYGNLGTFFPSGAGWVVILGLFALNLPLLVTDMSIWQRISAAQTAAQARAGSYQFALQLFFWMSLLVLFGAAFGNLLTDLPDTKPVEAALSYFETSIIFPVLITGLMAALLSTADTFVISSVQTVAADWKFYQKLKEVDFRADRLSEAVHRQILLFARVLTVVFVAAAVVVGLLVYNYLGRLLDFLFVMFAIQTSLAAPVLYALLTNKRSAPPRLVAASIILGAGVSIAGLLLALTGMEFLGVSVGLWTPLFALLSSSLLFAVGRYG